jgi:hypothetical protein
LIGLLSRHAIHVSLLLCTQAAAAAAKAAAASKAAAEKRAAEQKRAAAKAEAARKVAKLAAAKVLEVSCVL